MGNIKTVSENGVLQLTYTYDGLNQLIREDSLPANTSYVYAYDTGGNISSVKEYAYTTGTLGAVLDTYNYGYGDSNWKDKLTSYDGAAISYDALGNITGMDSPNSIASKSFTWANGRQLAKHTISASFILLGQEYNIEIDTEFEYDANGMRTKKITDGVTTEFSYTGDLLMSQTNGTDTLYFTYDAMGQMIGLQHNGTNYYYMRNLQGDVIGIYDSNANIVCRYIYDAWGRILSATDANGNEIEDTTHIAAINPIMYRGYYVDLETGLYYLQSRYYSPELRRFINADALFIAGDAITGANMFAYCLNNPVMYVDPSGMAATKFGNAMAQAILTVCMLSFLYMTGFAAFATITTFAALETAFNSILSDIENGKVALVLPIDSQSPPPDDTGWQPPKKNKKWKECQGDGSPDNAREEK